MQIPIVKSPYFKLFTLIAVVYLALSWFPLPERGALVTEQAHLAQGRAADEYRLWFVTDSSKEVYCWTRRQGINCDRAALQALKGVPLTVSHAGEVVYQIEGPAGLLLGFEAYESQRQRTMLYAALMFCFAVAFGWVTTSGRSPGR